MNNYSTQNSLTVKRLRSGDTFFISIGSSQPLFQAVDPDTGSLTPDWTVPDNQPVLTPQVTSARGNTVTLGAHQWKYNTSALNFNGAVSGDWRTDSTGKFQMNTVTGALRIIANLASKDNQASDTLTYSCTASSGGVDYQLTKSIDIQIQPMGSSSYIGTINATSEQLTENVKSTAVMTKLYLGGTEQTGYVVKWYKDDTLWSDKSGATITVTRSDVDGTQLIIAEFYKSADDTAPVFRAAIRITDTLDDYHLEHRFVVSASDRSTNGANREVSDGKPVYLEAYVINVRTNTELTGITGAKWVSNIMDKDTWQSLLRIPATGQNTGATNLVTVTTTQTDVDGAEKDVVVVSEVEWEM